MKKITVKSILCLSILTGLVACTESKQQSSSFSSSSENEPSSSLLTSSSEPKVSSITSSAESSKSLESSSSVEVKEYHVKCGHNNEIKNETPATCTEKGHIDYVCLTCGERVTEDIDKLSHDYSYEYGVYTNRQYQIRTMCSMCGQTQSGTNLNKANNKCAYKNKDNIIDNVTIGYVVKDGNKIKTLPGLGYEFDCWSDGNKEQVIDENNGDLVAIFKHKDNNMPILSVNLDNGVTLANVKRDAYRDASFEMEENGISSKLTGSFKGRGNGSWVGSTGKSGYTFKLESKEKIFGMSSKSKKWNIIANDNDQSMHINYSAYHLAQDKALPGIEWQAQTKFVEVFINNEFRGVYMLTDAVKAEKNRVPCVSEDDSGNYTYTDKNAGFLIEYDRYATSNSSEKPNDPTGDPTPIEGLTYFKVSNLYREFSVKYPDPDDTVSCGGNISDSLHKEAVSNIKATIQNFSNVLSNGTYEQLTEIVDINSMMDVYLIHELFKNSDVGWSSFYIYKKPNNSKLYFGPVWDFDLAAYRSRTNETSGKHISTKTLSGEPTNNVTSSYNDMLVKATKLKNESNKTQFGIDLNTRFNQYAGNIIQNIAATCGGNDNKSLAFAMNFKKWYNTTDASSQYATNEYKLFDWLLKRAKWMLNNDFVY
ncbi:MAG: CotH kinase family protein [Bacilli bacterium]|nr:CotH kinase family protein [Bacilli bacterium]